MFLGQSWLWPNERADLALMRRSLHLGRSFLGIPGRSEGVRIGRICRGTSFYLVGSYFCYYELSLFTIQRIPPVQMMRVLPLLFSFGTEKPL